MSYSFTNTTDHINLGILTLPQVNGSVVVWCNPSFASNDNTNHAPFIVRNGGGYIFAITKYSDNNIYAGWATNATSYYSVILDGSYTLNQNSWNVFVVTWDTSVHETKTYLNGTLIGSNLTALTTWDTAVNSIVAGNDLDANSTYSALFNGLVSNIAIFDRVLTSTEASELSLIEPSNLTPQPTHYWPLQTNATDTIGESNGTVTGATVNGSNPSFPGLPATKSAVIGKAGSPTNVYNISVLGGTDACTIDVYNGIDTTGTLVLRLSCDANVSSNFKLSKGLVLGNGCYVDVTLADPTAPPSVVTVNYKQI